MSYQNILVGVDGSKQADMAFERTVDVAKTDDAKSYLLSVINGEHCSSTGPGGYGFISHGIYDSAIEAMQKKLADYKKRAEAIGVKNVKTDVKVGNAKVELAEHYPRESDIDSVIIGVTGLNVVGRSFIGSTAAYTIREASCGVTVVKINLKNQKLGIRGTTYPKM